MQFPKAREGVPITVHGRTVEFCLWPVTAAPHGAILSPRLFLADPWPLMAQALSRLRTKDERDAGSAFLEQGHDFFRAASSASTTAAKPLLLYYAFLNIVKALVLLRLPGVTLDNARHGISERRETGGQELRHAFLETVPTASKPQMFDLLRKALTSTSLSSPSRLPIPALLRQVVTGHRLLSTALGSSQEHFIAIQDIRFLHDRAAHDAWLRMEVDRADLTRAAVGVSSLVDRCGLHPDWRVVRAPAALENGRIVIELGATHRYAQGWISDVLLPLANLVRFTMWQAVLSVPPYRRYYLFVPPQSELLLVQPQILSAYALFFYFGSITRYRPHHFDRIVAGRFGPLVEGFLNEQPNQLLFLVASEFAQREVARSAIV